MASLTEDRLLNLTYEHLREKDKRIADLYDQFSVYQEKIERTLLDGSLSNGARQAKAYDIYVEAVKQAESLLSSLSEDASNSIDSLYDQFIGKLDISIGDATAMIRELKERTESEAYDTLSNSQLARQAIVTYSNALGNGGIASLMRTLDEVFNDTHKTELTELNTLKQASQSLEQSFRENLQSSFPDFHQAEQIADSRVD